LVKEIRIRIITLELIRTRIIMSKNRTSTKYKKKLSKLSTKVRNMIALK